MAPDTRLCNMRVRRSPPNLGGIPSRFSLYTYIYNQGPPFPLVPRLILGRGLEDQLLASVVGAEQPDLEKTKNDLVQVRLQYMREHSDRTKITSYHLFAGL